MFPLEDDGLLNVPTSEPPVLHVEDEDGDVDAWQTKKLTDPAGAAPPVLPVTVAESPHALPTAVLLGGKSVVAMVGVVFGAMQPPSGMGNVVE